ncbi:protein-methionine-sulfoxide reductase heme-binding subunit MsrQ [uncultured Marinobacter sp.]|uniref:sulfite oxidase heme-binding subunit YedZ n=1 Tax=uncultured Marinobacter sp. TaxID=187379 RepID=UPI0030D93566
MARATSWVRAPWFITGFRISVAVLASLPLLRLLWQLFTVGLGPDPAQVVVDTLGITALQVLWITLALTPLQRVTGWPGWIRVRRLLGLYAFFYAVLHVLAFLQFIVGWQDLWASFTERPYVIAGSISFVILLVLAVTSPRAAMKSLGKRWKPLHRLVYIAAGAALVHFLWQARSDITEMVGYGTVLAVLLGFRVWWRVRKRPGMPASRKND